MVNQAPHSCLNLTGIHRTEGKVKGLGLDLFPKLRLDGISLATSSYKTFGRMSATQTTLVSINFNSKILANHQRGLSFKKIGQTLAHFPDPLGGYILENMSI